MIPPASWLQAAALGVALSAAAPAQVLLWEKVGTPYPNTAIIAGELAVLDDVNSDGYADIAMAVGAFPSSPECCLWILSGPDGSVLSVWPPFISTHGISSLSGAGDMDGDGRGDYVVGLFDGNYRGPNYAQVRSAVDNRLLLQVQGSFSGRFGEVVLGDLDVDGDARPDVVVSAYDENLYRGAVYVYANNGTLLHSITGLPGLSALGWSLAAIGDVDGDRCDDFVAGAVSNTGEVAIVFSGRTGQQLVRGQGVGYAVTGCGDLDGDGIPDFAGGRQPGSPIQGMARAFSGRTGEPLFTWTSRTTQQYGNSFGTAISGGQDADLDGVPDLIINGGVTNRIPVFGSTHVYSGRDGRLILAMLATANATGGGGFWVGKYPGSRFPTFVQPAGYITGPSMAVNRLRMFLASPPGVHSFGSACQGTLAAEPHIGIREFHADRRTRIQITGGEPGGTAILLLGYSNATFAGLPLPQPLHGLPGCQLFTSVHTIVPTALGTSGLSAGFGYVDLPWALNTTGNNELTVYGQWIAPGTGLFAPGGASDALEWQHEPVRGREGVRRSAEAWAGLELRRGPARVVHDLAVEQRWPAVDRAIREVRVGDS